MSDFDVFVADCPARTTLGVIGDRWSVVVVVALGEQPMRYSVLAARIGGISKKMLTQTLRKLQRNGLVTQVESEAVRPASEYTLTGLGTSLLGPVRELSRWAEEHTGELLDAQDAMPTMATARASTGDPGSPGVS